MSAFQSGLHSFQFYKTQTSVIALFFNPFLVAQKQIWASTQDFTLYMYMRSEELRHRWVPKYTDSTEPYLFAYLIKVWIWMKTQTKIKISSLLDMSTRTLKRGVCTVLPGNSESGVINSKWVWSGNTTITNRRQPRGFASFVLFIKLSGLIIDRSLVY